MGNLTIAIQDMMDDFVHYAKVALNVRNTKGKVVPFEINKAQEYIHLKLELQLEKTGKVRALIVKGRQQGCSTLIAARQLWKIHLNHGLRAYILTHESDATKNLFSMAKLYLEKMPDVIRPEIGYDSGRELTFPNLNASYHVGTAGNKKAGRSNTVQLLFGSEVAYWENAEEHAKGVVQTVPDENGTEIIMESTTNGASGWFYQQCMTAMKGEGEYQLIFIPWFWTERYRKPVPEGTVFSYYERGLATEYDLDDGQLMFRRMKISELASNGADGLLAFNQEYPCTVEEAFNQSDERNLITQNLVKRAVNSTLTEGYGHYIIGVDPSRGGKDRTAIAIRKGRVIVKVMAYATSTAPTLKALIKKLIKQYKPIMVNIDANGFDMGIAMVDDLQDAGYDMVNGIGAGGSALEPDKYFNRRAEYWSRLKLWLEDEPSKLPDRDDLLTDLTSFRYEFDLKSRIKLESKESLVKRGGRSPDIGDAIALTFAEDFHFDEDADLFNDYTVIDSKMGL